MNKKMSFFSTLLLANLIMFSLAALPSLAEETSSCMSVCMNNAGATEESCQAQCGGSAGGSVLNEAAGAAGYNTAVDDTALARTVGMVARGFISLVGIIFLCYTIYGGFLWMTAAGNDEKISKAKNILRDGTIGIILILAAGAIYALIATVMLKGTTGVPSGS
jgi:hypothetical protein